MGTKPKGCSTARATERGKSSGCMLVKYCTICLYTVLKYILLMSFALRKTVFIYDGAYLLPCDLFSAKEASDICHHASIDSFATDYLLYCIVLELYFRMYMNQCKYK